ncbi:hypothetical protein F4561_005188 [Lipingzhangella halophila]|uniref:Sigma-70-like protein n=1 Tax=Lipingzhangella halophila TaxID=1783352 RepID=A0A7W7RLU7_9ACTN|nr:hypothetical protein [Lipingzhangella halophila]
MLTLPRRHFVSGPQRSTASPLPDMGVPEAVSEHDQGTLAPSSATDANGLLSRTVRGDESAFTALFDCASAPVYGLLNRTLRDPGQATEVAETVWLQVWHLHDAAWPSTDLDPDSGPSQRPRAALVGPSTATRPHTWGAIRAVLRPVCRWEGVGTPEQDRPFPFKRGWRASHCCTQRDPVRGGVAAGQVDFRPGPGELPRISTALLLSRSTLNHTARGHRRAVGSRRRCPDAAQQCSCWSTCAKVRDLRRGGIRLFGVGTAWRYVDETTGLLSARAPGLDDELRRIRWRGKRPRDRRRHAHRLRPRGRRSALPLRQAPPPWGEHPSCGRSRGRSGMGFRSLSHSEKCP